MKNDSNDDEQRLLHGASLDDLIKMKMEEELNAEIQKSKIKHEIEVVTDIKKVPKELIFSKKSVFKVFNKTNKTETFINGMQAEALLGLQTSMRAKILNGQTDTFATDNLYVKFDKITL